jgi:hypothetical protein
MKRVTGIGGIFIKARDPQALGEWYREHLGMNVEDWGGVVFRWSDDPAAARVTTTWSPLNLEAAVDRSPPLETWRPTTTCAHDGPQAAGETATHPIEPPSAALAALRILAMAHTIAAVRALPARSMTTRSGASNYRF